MALFCDSIASANVLGDLNDDGQVDISDINIVINVMLGKSDVPADVNGDGVVDISDVNKVINIMLRANILYYSVDRAIDSLMAMPTPEHLRNVSLVMLCHSLDMGSPRKSDWKYQDRFRLQYETY